MLKKTITYPNYNDGTNITEDFYFNLSRAEILEMEATTAGGFSEKIKKASAENDKAAIFTIFKDLIGKSYGVKSGDGKRFIKSKELSEEFFQTEAYSVLLMEFMTNTDSAIEFINGIIPADMINATK